MSESQTASALVNNYYVTAIGSAIVNGNRQVSEAIKQWNAANRQKSNLQKNSELKTVGIEDSPWVKAAESETAMMDKLIELTDSATIQYRLQKSLTSLRDLQNADGGFTWIKGNESSEFTTWNVLSRFGYLKEAGYLDAFDPLLNDIVERATEYADSMMIKNIPKAEKPETVYPRYSEYIFIRSMLVGNNMPKGQITVAKDNIIDRTKKHWGKFTIEDKAEAAILLANYGEKAEAAKIVEQAHPDVIDLNFGCPVKRVAGKGAGAGMLRNVPAKQGNPQLGNHTGSLRRGERRTCNRKRLEKQRPPQA